MDRLRPENTKKKVDSLGRITLPKGLRDRLELVAGSELELFTMEREDGMYICMRVTEN